MVHLINILPFLVLNIKSPFEVELLHHTPPTFVDLKVFGSLCFASTLTQHKTKLDPRAYKCIYLGFNLGTKGISISQNVIFYEHEFPYSSQHHNTANPAFSPFSSFDFLLATIPDPTSYRRLVSHLLYLTTPWPDKCFTVYHLRSHNSSSPSCSSSSLIYQGLSWSGTFFLSCIFLTPQIIQ